MTISSLCDERRVLLENMHTAELSRRKKSYFIYGLWQRSRKEAHYTPHRWDVMLPSEYIIIVIKSCSLDVRRETEPFCCTPLFLQCARVRMRLWWMRRMNDAGRALWLTPRSRCQSPLMHHARRVILWPLSRTRRWTNADNYWDASSVLLRGITHATYI